MVAAPTGAAPARLAPARWRSSSACRSDGCRCDMCVLIVAGLAHTGSLRGVHLARRARMWPLARIGARGRGPGRLAVAEAPRRLRLLLPSGRKRARRARARARPARRRAGGGGGRHPSATRRRRFRRVPSRRAEALRRISAHGATKTRSASRACGRQDVAGLPTTRPCPEATCFCLPMFLWRLPAWRVMPRSGPDDRATRRGRGAPSDLVPVDGREGGRLPLLGWGQTLRDRFGHSVRRGATQSDAERRGRALSDTERRALTMSDAVGRRRSS